MSSLSSALNWNFHGFNPDQETWDAFEQRFTAFSRFNNVDESRQALQLLTALNPDQFGKLSASCVPKNPIDLPFEELIEHLRRLFKVILLIDHSFSFPNVQLLITSNAF
jgi:hypothetical protein